MEYTLEMTSQEEGVAVDPHPPPPALPRGDNDAINDAPSDEDASCVAAENVSPNPLVSETAEATGNDDEASSPLAMAVAGESGVRRRRGRMTEEEASSNGALQNGPSNDPERKGRRPAPSSPSYYTTRPRHWSFLPRPMFFAQTLREYRHNSCIMTPMASLVLLAIVVTSLVAMLLTVPQLLLGILLGPLVKRNFWLVEFLYRYDIARWGHLKIMELAGKRKKPERQGRDRSGQPPRKKLEGHSNTLGQRIEVVPGRVYVHPIPQFMDNIAYLIVCTPPASAKTLPLIGVLVDCGESAKVLQYARAIYDHHYAKNYPRNECRDDKGLGGGIEICAVLCTHRHHDHTAGVGGLTREVVEVRRKNLVGTGKTMYVTSGCGNGTGESDVYASIHNNVLVAGAAVEMVPHCNLFLKNGCFVPLPCVSIRDNGENNKATDGEGANDMNALVSIEVIGVPSHTRGSVVYALRNRAAPGIAVPIHSDPMQANPPLQSHLFTGDAIFTGGGGVPFEADYEYERDNFLKNPKRLKGKHGGSKFRPGAGTLSMERCFAEVLVRASGPWSAASSQLALPQDASIATASSTGPGSTLLYPGHEYTTDLLMRQLDQKTVPSDVHWTRLSPRNFFDTASHYLVSAHRRSLPPSQKLLTIPTPLEREVVVNTNFRMLKRRGECVVNALRLWYEFGAMEIIPDAEEGENDDSSDDGGSNDDAANDERVERSVFTTVYSADLASIVKGLRSGNINPASAADRIESLKGRLDEKMIGRRPIPSTLPSHKNVYLGVVALAILGAAPSAVTSSDANIMDLAPPVDSTDRIVISKKRLIAALEAMGLLSEDKSPMLKDVIHLLWREARLDTGLKLDIQHPDGTDVECSVHDGGWDDEIELGLLKLALFGVSLGQKSKLCIPCCDSRKPQYDEESWVETSKLRRTNGELVRHDGNACLLCRDVMSPCQH